MPEDSESNRKVFVVHGRNAKARDAMFEFLKSLDLIPLEWDEMVRATNIATPYIGQVLKTGFELAAAVVVLMTPDDEARLKSEFRVPADPAHEIELSGQPRQNVIYEAGMAMAMHETRTIVVELGMVRPMSDTAGRHVIRMDGGERPRKDLRTRLESAGCATTVISDVWLTAGDFEQAIAPSITPDLSEDIAGESSSDCNSLSRPISTERRHKTPNPQDFVDLGEYVWYLSNIRKNFGVSNADTNKCIQGFIDKLAACQLPITHEVAQTLTSLERRYYLANEAVTEQSLSDIQVVMSVVSRALKKELKDLTS